MLGEALRAVMGGVNYVREQKDLDDFSAEAQRRFTALGTQEGLDTAKFIAENPRAAITYMEAMGGMDRWYGALKQDADTKRIGTAVADIMGRGNYGEQSELEAKQLVLREGGNPNIVPTAPAIPGVSAYTHTPESIAEYQRTGNPSVLKATPWLEAQARGSAPKPNADLANLPQGAKYLKLLKARARTLRSDAVKRGIKDEKAIADFIRKDFEYQELERQMKAAGEGGSAATQDADAEIDIAMDRLRREIPKTDYTTARGKGMAMGFAPSDRPGMLRDLRVARQKKRGESDEAFRARQRELDAWEFGSEGSPAPAAAPKPATPAPAPKRDPRAEVAGFNELLRKKRAQ